MHAATQQGENTNGSNQEVDRTREEKSGDEIDAVAHYGEASKHGTGAFGTQIGICAQDFRPHQVTCHSQETRKQSESKHT